MKRPLFIQFFLFLYFLLLPLQAQELKRTPEVNEWWKAGVARAVITPQEYMWMAGFASRDKPAEGKLHDLWAKALALEDARGNRTMLITTDILGFSRDLSLSVCNRLVKEYHLERKNIILSSSHTHSGPVINSNLSHVYPPFDESQKKQIENNRSYFEDQIITVAGRAISSLAPVRLSSGVGIARFAVNRRENKWDDESLYNPNVNGPSDHVVQVIKVSDQSDQPIAIVFGYSCHATCLSINKWSGDYPGFAQIELEKTYPGLTSLFFAGFGADQNPLPRGRIPQARQYGKELAIAVEKVMEEPMKVLSSSIQTSYEEIELDLSPPPGNEELDSVIINGADWHKRWVEKMKEKLASGDEFPDSYPYYPVQSWQLGEQTLVVLGGEVVVDYSFILRKILGNDLMLMAYANDVMTYIPSERVLKEGGYEGEESMWVYGLHGTWIPGIEEKILNEVVRQVTLIRNGVLKY
ncbi:MAG: neutral/alkaline non-lysosomal ceramidase N-terminal domain-containing protein [Bacteroidales bacterium]|nr:neutral/alkaline non-lysosomal ceramidase N-terminal domain-containing protein [Bacteroidales bacterium]